MTEDQWLACAETDTLLGFLRGEYVGGGQWVQGDFVPSERKLRLFAVACCRRSWASIDWEPVWPLVEAAEQFADGLAGRGELAGARDRALRAWANTGAEAVWAIDVAAEDAWSVAATTCVNADLRSLDVAYRAAARQGRLQGLRGKGRARLGTQAVRVARDTAERAKCALLRDLFGNPFRAVRLDPAWLTADVLALARAAYGERLMPWGELDPARLAVLADALEECGCTAAEVLGHLRGWTCAWGSGEGGIPASRCQAPSRRLFPCSRLPAIIACSGRALCGPVVLSFRG
jgi:hypothetical protein